MLCDKRSSCWHTACITRREVTAGGCQVWLSSAVLQRLSIHFVDGDNAIFPDMGDAVLSRSIQSPQQEESTVAKQMVYEDEARQPLAAGVSKLARAVMTTLGPRGRNAVLERAGVAQSHQGRRDRRRRDRPGRSPGEPRRAAGQRGRLARPTRSPATAPPRPPCWPRPSIAKA